MLVSFVVIVAVVGVLLGVDRLLARRVRAEESSRVRRQGIMLALSLVGLIVIVLTLPVPHTIEGHLLTIIGLALTAALTLSSTTFVGNMMAGLMLRAVDNIRVGSFVQVGEQFGRVTERGLFHIEIQTEDRDLSTLPNLYLVTNPVKVVSSSGTIVSATVSLGYDTHHARVEGLLVSATAEAGLTDGFVQIVELGDFAVTYRAAGFLPEVRQLLTARSNLRRSMLDALHGGGVEIVSPAFMNQRPMATDARVIPEAPARPTASPRTEATPEAIMFEKADEAEKIESLRKRRAEVEKEIGELKGKGKGADSDQAKARLERAEREITALDERIAAAEAQVNGGKK